MSISKAISSYKYDPSGKNVKFAVDDNHQTLSFRVTTNPALEDNTKPIVSTCNGWRIDFKSDQAISCIEKQHEANKSTVLQVEEEAS